MEPATHNEPGRSFVNGQVPNWAELDKVSYHFRGELEDKAREHGYRYISETVALLYIEHGSLHKVAVRLDRGAHFVQKNLKRIGVRLKGRGGPNHVKHKMH